MGDMCTLHNDLTFVMYFRICLRPQRLERFIREGLPSDRPKANLLDDSIGETCFSHQVAIDVEEKFGEGVRPTFSRGPNNSRDHRRSLR